MKLSMGGGHKEYKMSGKIGKAKYGKIMKARTGMLTEDQKKLPPKLQKIIKA